MTVRRINNAPCTHANNHKLRASTWFHAEVQEEQGRRQKAGAGAGQLFVVCFMSAQDHATSFAAHTSLRPLLFTRSTGAARGLACIISILRRYTGTPGCETCTAGGVEPITLHPAALLLGTLCAAASLLEPAQRLRCLADSFRLLTTGLNFTKTKRMLLLLWKRALLLAAASLLGLWSLFTATTTESLHSLPALDQLSTLGKDKPRVAILEPTPYHSGEFAHSI